MHIVSYRGPGCAGGVSAALARAWESNLGSDTLWWHLKGNELEVTAGLEAPDYKVAQLPEEVIKGHYRFCNEFLWPVMHDLPQYARYVPEDRALYNSFNETLGWCIVRTHNPQLARDFFVQDYQMALVPGFLRDNAGFRSLMFWHIPWPKNVLPEHTAQIADIARGILQTEAIGFHTQEYADNFVEFIEKHLPEYKTNKESMAIWSSEVFARSSASVRTIGSRRRAPQAMHTSNRITRVVVAPLGIDYDHWRHLASQKRVTDLHPAMLTTPFILSVDRADYTKGVTDRIAALDLFFDKHPEWIGRVVFAQICGKTRTGLEAFESYWDECQRSYNDFQKRWATDNWNPLIWLEKSYSAADLALIYRDAAGMLVNPVRDGLNLTAKEYAACQSTNPGVLALSSGAGAWHELGPHALELEPHNPQQISEAIYNAITMNSHERAWRMALIKERIKKNTLSMWWHNFSELLDPRTPAASMDRTFLKETS